MSLGAATQPRRLYHHVLNGGQLKPRDVAYMVETIERLEQRVTDLEDKIDNARMAFSETHDSDESRCWAMSAALSED